MKVTSIQMNSTNNKDLNLRSASDLAEAAIKADKPDLVAFPEMMAFYGGTITDRKQSAENIPDGRTTEFLSALAKKHSVFVHGGSFYEKGDDGKVYNTTVAFNRVTPLSPPCRSACPVPFALLGGAGLTP